MNAFPEYDRNPLGTGPYRAKEWKTGEYLLLERHEDYWRGPAAIIHFAPPLAAIEAGGQWNTYEITAFGSHIVVHLNDTLVVDLEDESYSARPIALQNNGGFIRFRNVQVKLL